IPLNEPGQTSEPLVSVPSAAAARLAATAAPLPAEEPHVLRSSAYGFFTSPPIPDQPLNEWRERILAHSLRLVLPRITEPAARSRATTGASRWVMLFASASEPAVVGTGSAVSILSLIRIGIPCSGPRRPLVLRSPSNAAASANASGLSAMMLLSLGPALSMAAMRA